MSDIGTTLDLDEEIGGEVQLGDDTDCETCGWSSNQVSWYLEEGRLSLFSSIGCYGGERLVTDDLDEAAAFLTGHGDRYVLAADDLAAEADRMRTVVTAARS